MSRSPEEITAMLRDLNLSVRKAAEVAEARLMELNQQIEAAAATGMLANIVLLGPVFYRRDYPPCPGGRSTDIVVQAALLERGVGACLWDNEVFLEVQEQDALEAEGLVRIRAICKV